MMNTSIIEMMREDVEMAANKVLEEVKNTSLEEGEKVLEAKGFVQNNSWDSRHEVEDGEEYTVDRYFELKDELTDAYMTLSFVTVFKKEHADFDEDINDEEIGTRWEVVEAEEGSRPMQTWNFENGIEVIEKEFDGDCHEFDVYDGDRFLGTITPADAYDTEECAKEFNKGNDPITSEMEDGNGNTCILEGWGEEK